MRKAKICFVLGLLALCITGCASVSFVDNVAVVRYDKENPPVTAQVYVAVDGYGNHIKIHYFSCLFKNHTRNNYIVDWSQSTISYNGNTFFLFDRDDVMSQMMTRYAVIHTDYPMLPSAVLRGGYFVKNLVAGAQISRSAFLDTMDGVQRSAINTRESNAIATGSIQEYMASNRDRLHVEETGASNYTLRPIITNNIQIVFCIKDENERSSLITVDIPVASKKSASVQKRSWNTDDDDDGF